ncbi:phosphate ABC transporter permease [Anabaena sp. UHCC 0399]|uniref:phosphate ABC transporter permease n=1 Tax=Anabaena sp. UHCC 0399 TaxID=3110238 RepID=UPI002B1EEB17|nr:phosphate ABC transporter permease [Anabaena sp. UHCC 0399]MEA5566253.1 phosphate ABC transporter permease [Anabaena sp. UHCC 0399]
MLVPLTRQKFEQLIPLIATGPQYKYYWGKFANFLQRLLISVVVLVVILLVRGVFKLDFFFIFFLGVMGALFWMWYPAFQASVRNIKYRRYKYSGFFRGRILDWWITEKLIGKQETVNSKGELVIVENREKRINIEVGDDTGFSVELEAPLRPFHKEITRGQIAEMIVMSNRPDLSSIEDYSDVFVPSRNIWVGDYPYIRREFFDEVSDRLREKRQPRKQKSRRPRPRME